MAHSMPNEISVQYMFFELTMLGALEIPPGIAVLIIKNANYHLRGKGKSNVAFDLTKSKIKTEPL